METHEKNPLHVKQLFRLFVPLESAHAYVFPSHAPFGFDLADNNSKTVSSCHVQLFYKREENLEQEMLGSLSFVKRNPAFFRSESWEKKYPNGVILQLFVNHYVFDFRKTKQIEIRFNVQYLDASGTFLGSGSSPYWKLLPKRRKIEQFKQVEVVTISISWIPYNNHLLQMSPNDQDHQQVQLSDESLSATNGHLNPDSETYIASQSAQLSEDYNMDDYNNHDDYLVIYNGNAEVVGNFRALNFYKASDINVKEDVSLLSERFDCRDTMLRIDGVDYKFRRGIRADMNRRFIGYIAQQVESVVPEAVQLIDGILHVDYESLIPFLSESIKQNYNDIKHIQSDNQKIHLVLDDIYNRYIENNMHSENNSAEQTRKQTTSCPWSPTCKILSIVVSTILILGVIAFVMVNTLNNTVFPASVAPTSHPRGQREILEAFYQATNGKSWKRASNWLTNMSICEWQGVHCHGELEDVIELDLSGNYLTGTIPDVIAELPFLTTLAVMQNELTGSIPESIFRLPNLQALFLSSNKFNGTISPAISRATHLEQISLNGNLISGELPPELGKLPRLRRLEMKRNRLQGSFSLLPSPSIQKIDLSSNLLSGQLPDLSGFTALTALDLSKNRFRGSFPSLPSSMQEIDLSTNGLSEQLPDLSSFTELTALDLSKNFFEGTLPTLPQSLLVASFSDNKFNGTLETFKLLREEKIVQILVNGNYFAGDVSYVTDLHSLEQLDVSFNQLSQLSHTKQKLNDYVKCDATGNVFACPLPDWFMQLCKVNCTDWLVK